MRSRNERQPLKGPLSRARDAGGRASYSAEAGAEAAPLLSARISAESGFVQPPLRRQDSERRGSAAIRASIAANVVLFSLKAYAAYATSSMSILAAAVDSLLDLVSQLVLAATEQLARSAGDKNAYPAGRTRMEPVGVLVCSVLMGSAALEVLRESVVDIAEHASGHAPLVEDSALALGIVASAILAKVALYAWCRAVARQTRSASVAAVAQDHFNDVLSNLLAAVASCLAMRGGGGRWWWVDPVGGAAIGAYIIHSWVSTGLENVELLVGRAADPAFLQEVRRIAVAHDRRVKVDVVRAYHFGRRFLLEVEIVLPPTMILRESHDIGIGLQRELEKHELVERCFVHCDYTERPFDEHDEASWDKGRPAGASASSAGAGDPADAC